MLFYFLLKFLFLVMDNCFSSESLNLLIIIYKILKILIHTICLCCLYFIVHFIFILSIFNLNSAIFFFVCFFWLSVTLFLFIFHGINLESFLYVFARKRGSESLNCKILMYDNNDKCNSRKKLTCKSQVRTDSNKFSFYPWKPDFEKEKKKKNHQEWWHHTELPHHKMKQTLKILKICWI